MADGREVEELLSRSPKEDFDPLRDELAVISAQNGYVSAEDHDPDSPSSSMEMEQGPLYKYGITPPTNSREQKRQKGKDRSSKLKESKSELHNQMLKEGAAMAKAHGAAARRMCDAASQLSNVEECSDGELSGDSWHENSQKRKKDSSRNFKTSRGLDRDFKLGSAEHLMNDVNSPAVSLPPISVDSPNRFLSLNSKPVSFVSTSTQTARAPRKPLSLSVPPRRKTSLTTLECPPERREFSLTFTTLINLGNKKECLKESRVTPYLRQQSREQEVWQNQLSDLLWLELQAWHQGRSMQLQDGYLIQAREGAGKVLEHVLTFKILPTEDSVEAPAKEGDPLCGSMASTDGMSLMEAVEKQKEAIQQVTALFTELEAVESLYPSLKAMERECPTYASREFQNRLGVLYQWLNLTMSIGRALQLMAKLLYIDQIPTIQYWPWLDSTIPILGMPVARDTTAPDICLSPPDEEGVGEEEEEEEEYEDAQDEELFKVKNVRFDLSSYSTINQDGQASSPVEDSFMSSGPSDTSTPRKPSEDQDPPSVTISRSSSCMSVDELSKTCIYRYFVDRTLKKTGLHKLRGRLKSVVNSTLIRARHALRQLPSRPSYADVLEASLDTSNTGSAGNTHLDMGDQNPRFLTQFQDMGLPSFKPTYLFLVRIPLDVVHECLRLRLEQRPEMEPSILSVGQLIRECKEVLQEAVLVKQYYLNMATVVVSEAKRLETVELELETFEEDSKDMLELYFSYIQTWMCELQHLPEMSKKLKTALVDEWVFTKDVCRHVRGGEANAGNRFCRMGSSLLNSISDYLDTGMDACIDLLYDCTTAGESLEDSGEHSESKCFSRSFEVRQAITRTCRKFKDLFSEARERASKALGFAKMLHKDLEIAADYNIAVTAAELLEKLHQTGHLRVLAPHSAGYLMFIPPRIAHDRCQVLQLLNVTCGNEDVNASPVDGTAGYMLLVKCESCADMQRICPLWKGGVLCVEPTADTTIALSHIEVEGLLLVVTQSSLLDAQRKAFEETVGPVVQLCNENTSCHQAIAESLLELKNAALELRDKVASAIKQVDEKLSLDDITEMDESEKLSIHTQYRETLHQCYNFGFEYHKEVTRLVSGDMRVKLMEQIVQFAKQWMKFVSDKCERGKGRRPRWASQGLDFLSYTVDPKVLGLLSEEEFLDLKKHMNDCICHVIGEKVAPGSPSTPGIYGNRMASPEHNRHSILRNISCPEQRLRSRSPSMRSINSEPATPYMSASPSSENKGIPRSRTAVSMKEGEEGGIVMEIVRSPSAQGDMPSLLPSNDVSDSENKPFCRMEQVYQRIEALEAERTQKLHDSHVIGRVTNRRLEVDYHVNVRRVKFKWQRGIKIGEGNFGKVYTAVNMDTGELMAMKEIRFQPNDHQTVKDIADEIKIFEAITHPTLVKYYGVEVHREEMLIFMEYCAGGTLADVAKLGLAEGMIRKYTADILGAIAVLHESGIVHRDIKGPNIFLSEKGIKLGDFGCAVKLKNHTTMPGELKTMAGTTAYIAPEVITKSDQGRAADIWSLGCVVIEMATGKRPWHELENNFAIMFKVGMGAQPPFPDNLSLEGHDFLSHCLQQDSRYRWTAQQLLDHQFVKVGDLDWDS